MSSREAFNRRAKTGSLRQRYRTKNVVPGSHEHPAGGSDTLEHKLQIAASPEASLVVGGTTIVDPQADPSEATLLFPCTPTLPEMRMKAGIGDEVNGIRFRRRHFCQVSPTLRGRPCHA